MNKQLVTVLLYVFPFWLSAQTLTGKVYQEGTTNVIASASVYYSGSTNGTLTNADGYFYLPAKMGQVPLVISCVGYYSAEVNNYKTGEAITVYLKPKQLELQGVVVTYDGMSREEKVRIFTQEFIGTSKYAKSCTIINIDDIDLSYNRKTQTLTAESSKPIRIQNDMLGYTIRYYLDQFKKTPDGVQYSGNYIFKEISPLAADKKVKRNREEAYDGSRMQFIRSLWNHNVRANGFSMYDTANNFITEDSIIVNDSLQNKYLYLKNRLYIVQYIGGLQVVTSLTPSTKFSFINKEGYYGLGIGWAGVLAKQRIGDLLPFEYQSEKELRKTNLDKPEKMDRFVAKIGETPVPLFAAKIGSPSNPDLHLFKAIVLEPANQLTGQSVVRKWSRPIVYKIYGTTGNDKYDKTLAGHLHQFFAKMGDLTAISIKQAVADSAVNFFIFIGDVEDADRLLTVDAKAYFNNHKASTGYYIFDETGYTSMVQRVLLDDLTLQIIWPQVRQQILGSLGFPGTIKSRKKSLFSNDIYYWTPDRPVDEFDAKIIKTLYQPTVKPGMTEQGLNELLKDLKF